MSRRPDRQSSDSQDAGDRRRAARRRAPLRRAGCIARRRPPASRQRRQTADPPSSTGGPAKVAGRQRRASTAIRPAAHRAARPGGMPPIDQLQGRPIGRVLTKMGKVTREQVVEALDFQKSKGGALGRILIDLGYIKETDLNIALAAQKGYELVNLDGVTIPPIAINAVPAQIATTNKVLPIEFDPATKKLTVVMASQENFRALDDLRSVDGLQRHRQDRRSRSDRAADPQALPGRRRRHRRNPRRDGQRRNAQGPERPRRIDRPGHASRTPPTPIPVRKLINLVLLQAIKDKASDIHFEPFEDEFKMRYRIDGVLYEMMPPPAHIAAAISSRIKVMANLDIAERRMPQDGRIELNVNNQPIDLRVSVLPTMFGESVVMRVLDRSNVQLDLDKIGMRDDDLSVVRQLIHKPNGIVIVTGPTGSGKTTTLYSALRELNDHQQQADHRRRPGRIRHRRHHPVPDQAGNRADLRAHSAIDAASGPGHRSWSAKFATRKPPRSPCEASLTGHLVFSTLHTNDAPSVDRASARSGPGAVPDHRDARRRHRPAAGAKHLHQLQDRIHARAKSS